MPELAGIRFAANYWFTQVGRAAALRLRAGIFDQSRCAVGSHPRRPFPIRPINGSTGPYCAGRLWCRREALGWADPTRPLGCGKQPTNSGSSCFGSHSTTFGEEDAERDRHQEDDVERERAEHRAIEGHADELRRHQQRQAIGRRDQAEPRRGDDHDAHVHRT